MVPAIFMSLTNQEQKEILSDSIQKPTQATKLAMQWTLDENSKLICKWLPDNP